MAVSPAVTPANPAVLLIRSSFRSSARRKERVELSFIAVIVEYVVQFGPRLHASDDRLLGTFPPNRLIDSLGRRAHRAKRRQWVQHETHAGRAKFVDRKQRRLSEFG